MKKSIVAIVVLLGGAAAAAPYISGAIAESETRTMVDAINLKSSEYGEAKIVSYDRGYRSSKVEYAYQPPAAMAMVFGMEESIRYDCDYTHGFGAIDYVCDLTSNPGYQQFVEQNFAGQDPISITGNISAFGGLTQELAIANIDTRVEDGTVFKVQPSKMVMESDADFSVYKASANFGEIEVSDANGSMNFSPSSMKMNIKPTKTGLYESDYSLSAESISFLDAEQNRKISGFKVTGSSKERGDRMDGSVTLDIASMSEEGGAAFNVDNLSVSADFLGLNSQALVEYQELAMKMQADLLASLESQSEPEVDPNQMMAFLPIVEKLLDKDLNVKFAVAGDYLGKPNSADIDLKLLKKTSLMEFSALMFNPESVLQNLDLKLNAKVNQGLLESNPAAAASMAQNPLFAQKGDNFEMSLKLGADSELNGEAVTIEQLQALFMPAMMPN